MTFQFTKATKKQVKARIAISGPAGSGKSYTALLLAKAMCKRIAAIDTEHGSLSKYRHLVDFDVLELDDFHPNNYVGAIQAAQAAGYDGLIIDSASHEWNGRNGCLELVDIYAKRNKGGNNWAAWSDVTPLHTGFIEAVHQADMHVFACFRSKMDYIQTEDRKIKKVGMAPITREGAEYEFDLVLEMDLEHSAVITKSRCEALADKVVAKPGATLAKAILQWLGDVDTPTRPTPVTPPTPTPAVPPTNGHAAATTLTERVMVGEEANIGEPPSGEELAQHWSPICADCGQPIQEFVSPKGKRLSPREVADAARNDPKIGAEVCIPCGKQRKAGVARGG